MAIVYLKTTGFEVVESADEVRDEISDLEDRLMRDTNRDTVEFPGVWIELTALRPPKPDEQPEPENNGMMETTLHVRSCEIVAVGE